MPIKFPPARKSILICDFNMGGFQPPEMVKRRPVVVLVGRLPHRANLATVVPLSGTPPNHRGCDYQCPLIFGNLAATTLRQPVGMVGQSRSGDQRILY
ncbi:type II toxin-antitoxin system PemK/MazF family toxin [Neogemmobacter tilapiae]|uniref:type II toxin-antitoxin system PemK/MazF family toxin n=1 Tax=Neogemmobacter tilapiae TaxID=875041 RepID=UPI001676C26D